MATYEVCSDVNVTPGGSFIWYNGNSQTVVITPQNPPWPLPNSSYTVGNLKTSAPIAVSSNAVPGTSYTLNVLYQTTPGGPCATKEGGNPKIIINPGKKEPHR
jgi:hypothetical protein